MGQGKNLKIAYLLSLLALPECFLQAQPIPALFRVVGYYSLEAAQKAHLRQVPFKRLTHVNLWFYNPDTLGNFTRDFSRLRPFIDAAHRNNVSVLFSIAGGSPHPYYHNLLQENQRTQFINNIVSETLLYNVDGIDVDIESTDIDDNYESFVVELGAALRQHHKLITAAIAMYYKDQISDRALEQFDFVNIMSYDRTGPWRPFEPGPHSHLDAAIHDLEYFGGTRGIPQEKLTLGVPFYGYGFGPEVTSAATSMTYRQIVSRYRGSEKQDFWKTNDGRTIYYNGIPTIKQKTELAKEKASGIMIWQLRGDAKGRKSLLKIIYRTARKKETH